MCNYEGYENEFWKLGTDKYGRKPVGSWAMINRPKKGRYGKTIVQLYPDKAKAIEDANILHSLDAAQVVPKWSGTFAERELIVGYIACNQNEDGTLTPFFENKYGEVTKKIFEMEEMEEREALYDKNLRDPNYNPDIE